jgi:hypothetical protein
MVGIAVGVEGVFWSAVWAAEIAWFATSMACSRKLVGRVGVEMTVVSNSMAVCNRVAAAVSVIG